MYQKQFNEWNQVKQRVNKNKLRTTIRVGEVRWIIFGVNIGSEIDGKGDEFIRPGLILHVIGNELALVVPMTSKQKTLPGYFSFPLKNRLGSLCLHQLKVISQNRILRRIEHISDSRLASVRHHVLSFHNFAPAFCVAASRFKPKFMPHIHELIDFTVTCMILHPTEPKILLINHKLLNTWLPVGGHIELNEDPDEAIAREVAEECGLSIEMISHRHAGEYPETKMLLIPETIDIHTFNATHRHVNLGYHARALSAEPKLAPEEHHDIQWFAADELADPNFNIKPSVRAYALEFLQKFV